MDGWMSNKCLSLFKHKLCDTFFSSFMCAFKIVFFRTISSFPRVLLRTKKERSKYLANLISSPELLMLSKLLIAFFGGEPL